MLKKFILPVFIFIVILTACGDAEPNAAGGNENTPAEGVSAETPETPEEIKPDYIPDNLNDHDFGGYEFRVVTRSTCVHPLYIDAESINGELINDAIYLRNRAIEERFNVRVSAVIIHEGAPESDNANSTPFVRKNIMAGDDFADIAMLHKIDAGALAAQGLFIDWRTVPNADLSKPWWDKNVVEGLTIGGRLYLNTGHYNIESYDYTWGMVFNKQLWQDKGLPNVYDTVNEGKWTLDLFAATVKDATVDTDGDGQFTEADQWGFVAIDRGGLSAFMFASDQRVYAANGSGGFELVLNTERMQSIVEKVYDIYHQNNSTYIWQSSIAYFPETQPLNMFANGKGLIASARLAGIPILRGMDTDFGIIPYPKFDESQKEYVSFSDGHSSMMAIPKTIQNTEAAGTVIEALSAANYNTVMASYYDINLQTKFARDEESAKMMDIVIKNRIFDLGYVYNTATGSMGFMLNDLVNQKKTTFVSEYERKEAAALRALDNLIANFEMID